MTFEIKGGFVGLQGKVIYSRNVAGPGNRCWSRQRDELGFTGKSTHFLPNKQPASSSCPPEVVETIQCAGKVLSLPVGEL